MLIFFKESLYSYLDVCLLESIVLVFLGNMVLRGRRAPTDNFIHSISSTSVLGTTFLCNLSVIGTYESQHARINLSGSGVPTIPDSGDVGHVLSHINGMKLGTCNIFSNSWPTVVIF